VPLLSVRDPLPVRPRRIVVAGTSGSGKTTLAQRIARVLGITHVELDSLYHGPGWTPRPSFVRDVHDFAAGPAWVTEWQYREVLDHLAGRAELMVWLDPPRSRVMRQVIVRTVRRRLRGEELWIGNTEPPLRTVFTDREHMIRWAWNTHRRTPERVLALHDRRPDLPIVRLRSRADIDRWLAALS